MTETREHPTDCLFCKSGEAMVHNYEPPRCDAHGREDCMECFAKATMGQAETRETQAPEIAQYVVSVPATNAYTLTTLLDALKAGGFTVEWFRRPLS
jgi:hypothetical protein